MRTPVLVGEANPYQEGNAPDDEFALYPLPKGASGHRLQQILGLSCSEYLTVFDRRNLCGRRWSLKEARARASEIYDEGRPLILCGAKVCKAFGKKFEPFTLDRDAEVVVLPHPSGRSLLWNDTQTWSRARTLVYPLIGKLW